MKKQILTVTRFLKSTEKHHRKDIDIWSAAREEEPMKVRARELAISQKLEMKISDIEFQGDGSKATFTTRQMTELILDFD
jgi:hypothetical protein